MTAFIFRSHPPRVRTEARQADFNQTVKMKSVNTVADAAALPFRIVEAMRLPCGYERSFKLLPGAVLANRYLLGIETRRATGADFEQVCRRLGMPGQYLDSFVEQLGQANLVFLGFEADAMGGAVYKVYLEFWDHARARYRAGHEAARPLLTHRGFKWDIEDPARRVVTDYHWVPGLKTTDIVARIETVYDNVGGTAGLDALRDMLRAADRAGGRGYIFVEVSEAGNSRQSFDINLYSAGLRVRDIGDAAARVARRLEVPPDRFGRLMELVGDKLFGHVSGGQGRDGSEYFTVYYEN